MELKINIAKYATGRSIKNTSSTAVIRTTLSIKAIYFVIYGMPLVSSGHFARLLTDYWHAEPKNPTAVMGPDSRPSNEECKIHLPYRCTNKTMTVSRLSSSMMKDFKVVAAIGFRKQMRVPRNVIGR